MVSYLLWVDSMSSPGSSVGKEMQKHQNQREGSVTKTPPPTPGFREGVRIKECPPARKPTEVSRPASTTRRRARKQEKLRLAMWATPILGTAWALPYPLTGQHDLTP